MKREKRTSQAAEITCSSETTFLLCLLARQAGQERSWELIRSHGKPHRTRFQPQLFRYPDPFSQPQHCKWPQANRTESDGGLGHPWSMRLCRQVAPQPLLGMQVLLCPLSQLVSSHGSLLITARTVCTAISTNAHTALQHLIYQNGGRTLKGSQPAVDLWLLQQ